MNKNRMIPLDEIQKRLQDKMHYKHPQNALLVLVNGWLRHPEYPSPSRDILNVRMKRYGFAWLKDTEIPSFESYIGYKLF